MPTIVGLLWHFKVFIDLEREKVKISIFSATADTLTKNSYRNISGVVLYQLYVFCKIIDFGGNLKAIIHCIYETGMQLSG